MSQSRNVVSVKRWGTRLKGQPSAKALREHCQTKLIEDGVLVLNMAGVKDLSPGFAQECFGKLYLEANKRGTRVSFQHTSKTLAPLVLQGIKANF